MKDEDAIIGSKDDKQRLKIMSKCNKAIQRNIIGPKSKSSLLSASKMNQVILDISKLRKKRNSNWLAEYTLMKNSLLSGKNQFISEVNSK